MASPDKALSNDLRAHAMTALDAGRYEEAIALFRLVVDADPRNPEGLHNLGCALQTIGRQHEARAVLEQALALAPDALVSRHALGLTLMSLGDYRTGWPLWEARHLLGRREYLKPGLPFPEWRGEDLAGKKLLLFPEQGLGDQIQFVRFAPWLAARGADVTVLCHPALTRLFEQNLDLKVVAAQGQAQFDDPDYWLMMGSIVGRAGLGLEDIPGAPYLRAVSDWPRPAGRIGVVARGNPGHKNDAHRSLDPAAAAALLALPGAVDLAPESSGARDFADTAALVEALDLVITVDTSVAHLAGAMGKRVWILIPRHQTDWRWLEPATGGPWYPTATLFRQPAPGDWDSVLTQVRAALAGR